MFIKTFQQLSRNDADIAGGKGASLGEITTAGIPVPPGFVVLSEAFEKFLEKTDLNVEIAAILETVDTQKMHTVENASEKIQLLILEAQMPEDIAKKIEEEYQKLGAEYVAVRSSATAEDGAEAAWAGQLDSFLNTTGESLLRNVQKCWASLFTPRAIFYRFEKSLHKTKISVAVVVQKMVQSEKSGIAFSVHPVTEDYNQLIIEAGFGLGEAIVSGSITPDSYVVDKSKVVSRKSESEGAILDINVSTQTRGLYRKESGGNVWQDIAEPQASSQVLSEEEILELSELIIKIENHYGFPCDIEWAQENGNFYITQSRPITTLKKVQFSDRNKLMVEEISSLNLSKNWDAKLSIFVIDFGVSGYFEPLEKAFGYLFSGFFVNHREGMSAGYLIDEDMDNLARICLDKISRDEKIIEKWCDKLKKDTDLVYIYYKKEPKWYLDYENMKEFYDVLMEFSVYQIVVKELPNRLGSKMLEKYGKILEDARKYCEHIFHEIDDVLNKPLSLIIEKTDYSYEEIASITYHEYLDYLKNNSLPDREILKKRYRHCAMYYAPNLEIIDGKTADDILMKLTEKSYDGQNIKGNIGYRGKVKGKCRIVDNVAKFDQFKKGEILVAGMTNPNYLPIMKIAGAIVTDAGGVLSHAAIVARELKIPCIIGTKIATQVLQDGDLVEVDADNGVVRILERAGGEGKNIKSEDISIGKLADYQRMFRWKNQSFLITSFFMNAYKSLDALVISDSQGWVSYIPKTIYAETLDKGVGIYGNDAHFKKYVDDYGKNKVLVERISSKLTSNAELNEKEVAKFFRLICETVEYYAKTEFFYTDKAFYAQEKNKTIKKNFEDFEQFKIDGRKFLNKIFLEKDGYLNIIIDAIAKKYNLTREDIICYSYEEILRLFSGEQMAAALIGKRKLAYIFRAEKEELGIVDGEVAQKIIDRFLKDKSVDIIRGQIANKGKVRGKVRVFYYGIDDFSSAQKTIDAMQEGEVLVAETTSPEIMMACKKASAIVTSQGGMMSHAAIISREMNIPCIVGTDIATQVLHDGDMVEVDANEGVVRILK